MDINKLLNTHGAAAPPPAAKKGASAEASTDASAQVATQGDEGSPKLLVAALTERIMAEPAVDNRRVARLASQVESGSYQMNPQRAAQKMISLESALG